jgi:NAD-dependent dihydropyrimidine dehydrogenase PreA subunit
LLESGCAGRGLRPAKDAGSEERAMPAKVKAADCTACGKCAEVCPVECIKVDDVAVVNAAECTDCGTCVDECPVDAITVE